eukprot:TRINITY_DN12289_c0_g1_i6.p1 TRINITY_DN12289_c0_g1~~TRINITY_DN12289_c0_g1_i6.p1  ORF type:complete len:218 (+),score=39.35 TRINITY_DN12289_c0_g1_i6:180-833(+)
MRTSIVAVTSFLRLLAHTITHQQLQLPLTVEQETEFRGLLLVEVVADAKAVCGVTHASPRCHASCVAVCVTLALFLLHTYCHDQPPEPQAILDTACEWALKELASDEEKSEFLKYSRPVSLAELHLDDAPTIGYTYKAMACALWGFLSPDVDFEQAITLITMEAGDADTNGAVAGAVLGAKHGLRGIPARWLDNLLHLKWLDQQINQLIQLYIPDQI